MKTKSNFQKARLLTLGLVMVFGMGVYANGIEKPVSGSDQSKESSDIKDVFASYLKQEAEPVLEVEDWMMDENSFDVFASYYQIEQEEALEVEDWMKEESTFYPSHSDLDTFSKSDKVLGDKILSDDVWYP